MIDEEQTDNEQSEWLGTTAAARRLGITTRTLYRFIDEGYLTAYRMGRVIRVMSKDIDSYIEACRIPPGTISHLYPEVVSRSANPDETNSEDASEVLDAGDVAGLSGTGDS